MSHQTEGTGTAGRAFWPAAQGEFGGHAYSPTAAFERIPGDEAEGDKGSGAD